MFIAHLLPLADQLDNTVDPTAYTGMNAVQVASVLVGVFLPILVAFVTKQTWSAQRKAIILAACSAVTGFLTEFINSDNFVWQQALLTTIVTFVTAVATHFGLWSRPNGDGVSISAKVASKGVK